MRAFPSIARRRRGLRRVKAVTSTPLPAQRPSALIDPRAHPPRIERGERTAGERIADAAARQRWGCRGALHELLGENFAALELRRLPAEGAGARGRARQIHRRCRGPRGVRDRRGEVRAEFRGEIGGSFTSFKSRGIHSASFEMPPLPGAHQVFGPPGFAAASRRWHARDRRRR